MEETFTGQYHHNYADLVLKQVKDFILKFSISGCFFLEKIIFESVYHFLLGGCADEADDNWRDYQGYKYVYFLQYYALTVNHFINDEGVC